MTDKLSAVILAAGNSSRMGRPKAALEYRGETFLEIVCRKVGALRPDKTVVVLGKDRKAVLAVWRPGGEEVVFNGQPELGQIHSLRLALETIDEDSAFIICLVDQPLVRTETYKAIMDFWLKNTDCLVIPSCCRGTAQSRVPGLMSQSASSMAAHTSIFKRGHPILIPAIYRELCFNGPTEKGLHWVTHHESVKVADLMVTDTGILADFDTPEDYEKLLAKDWGDSI